MKREIQATVTYIAPTDVLWRTQRIEELRKQLADKEQAAHKVRAEIEQYEASARRTLARHPELLAEFEAELSELARRDNEHAQRVARVNALREKYPR